MTRLLSRAFRRLSARWRTSSLSQQATFTAIVRANAWGDPESVSGTGSTRARGADFQDELVAMLDAWRVGSILDAPCGDFNWMRNVLADRTVSYTGADMTRADLPAADLVLCRDALVHLSFADAKAAIRNFRRSGARYLLTTTFVERTRNSDIPTGGWRVLNLEAAPFWFPAPLALIDERCTHSDGAYRDKRLGLWELQAPGQPRKAAR